VYNLQVTYLLIVSVTHAFSCVMWNVFEMYSLNDLAVIGNDQFYFTNDKRYHYFVELMFRAPLGSIGFYNGSQAELLEENLFMPNGLAVSNDDRCVEPIRLTPVFLKQ